MAKFNFINLKILQWNCRSIIPKIDRLKAFITNHNLDIFCLNETWLEVSKSFRIPLFNIFRKDRNISYGSVLIGVRKNIEFKSLNLTSNSQIECVAVLVKYNDLQFSIVCIYIPPNVKFSVNDIKSVLENIPPPFYILGDLNAHNLAWGSDKTDGK